MGSCYLSTWVRSMQHSACSLLRWTGGPHSLFVLPDCVRSVGTGLLMYGFLTLLLVGVDRRTRQLWIPAYRRIWFCWSSRSGPAEPDAFFPVGLLGPNLLVRTWVPPRNPPVTQHPLTQDSTRPDPCSMGTSECRMVCGDVWTGFVLPRLG